MTTHQECLLFCFIPIIQLELNLFLKTWNSRHIRQSAAAPGGKPDILFHLPSTTGFTSQGVKVEEEDLDVAESVVSINNHPIYLNKDLHELLWCYVQMFVISPANNADEGLEMYVKLLRLLERDNFMI